MALFVKRKEQSAWRIAQSAESRAQGAKVLRCAIKSKGIIIGLFGIQAL